MLDIVRLRVLAAVAAHGSVTRAAKHLHYAQPSVSHHLARLESETGARLVQRVGRGIRLTPEGETLARRATEIIGRVDAAEAELEAMVGLRTGRVRFAGFQSALTTLVPETAAAMRRDHPGVELSLTECHPEVALAMLRSERSTPPSSSATTTTFPATSTAPTCSTTRCTWSAAGPVRRSSTTAPRRGSPAAPAVGEFLDACGAVGFTPEIAYTSDDIIVQQALVAAGLGVTTNPGLALRTHRRDDVETTPLDHFRRRVHLVTYGEPPDPPATEAFVSALRTAAQRYA
ncbi:hypothetical protein GCM10029992_32730 [Glycomyces albus]